MSFLRARLFLIKLVCFFFVIYLKKKRNQNVEFDFFDLFEKKKKLYYVKRGIEKMVFLTTRRIRATRRGVKKSLSERNRGLFFFSINNSL